MPSSVHVPPNSVTRRELPQSALFSRQAIKVNSNPPEPPRRVEIQPFGSGCRAVLYLHGDQVLSSFVSSDASELKETVMEAIGRSMLVWRTVEDDTVVGDSKPELPIYASF